MKAKSSKKRKRRWFRKPPDMQTITLSDQPNAEPKGGELFLISGSPRQIAEFVAEMRRH